MSLLIEADSSLPLVQIAVSRLSGASSDPEGKEGLARLVTRLMRRTADGRSADELDEAFDALGSSLGADVSTSCAGFSGSTISRSLPQYASLLNAVLARPSLDESELERLKRETLAELEDLLDNDRALVRRWFGRSLFQNHPYGRTAIGNADSLARITRDDVQAHYEAHITQQNLVFAFSGDIESEQAEQLRDQFVRGLPEGQSQRRPLEHPAGIRGRQLVFVDKPERTQTQILIGGLGTYAHDADHVALLVANTAFGGTFTARLTQEVRAKRGWSYGAYSHLPYERRRQSFSMWTFPAASDAPACIALQLEMLREWIEEGITAEEFEYAQRYLIHSNVFNIDTATKRVSLTLDEILYELPKDYHEHFAERVRSVTLEEVNAAVRSRISTENLLICVVGTERDTGAAVRQAIPDLAEYRVVPFDHG